MPRLNFGDWQQWDDATSIAPSKTLPGGLYLLAHCHSGRAPAKATPKSVPREGVYIGISKNLHSRPVRGRHKGVTDYLKKIDANKDRLFLATAHLFDPTDAILRIYAEHLETSLIWQYTDHHGHPPALHFDQKGHNTKEVEELGAPSEAVRRLALLTFPVTGAV